MNNKTPHLTSHETNLVSQNAVLVSSNILRLREKQSTIIVIKIIRNNGSKQSDSF